MAETATAVASPERAVATRPPWWMILVTALLAFLVLAMAVAETNLWLHYLIDAGEPISLAGVGFVAIVGWLLYARRQLSASLPLMAPWLLFPVITQGDQIIDNLSITWMRVIVHLLLGLIFGIPVAVIVSGVRAALARDTVRAVVARAPWARVVPGLSLLASGRSREGSAVLASLLLTALMIVAVQFLGLLMVVTLSLMVWGVLAWGFSAGGTGPAERSPVAAERRALVLLVAGVAASLALYVGYKNRPGAYQGSPAYFMDPAQKGSGFQLTTVPVPASAVVAPSEVDGVRSALSSYGEAFEQLVAGYYVLDRNYNYDFHNQLFLRSTPLLADYRRVGLARVHEAEKRRARADQATSRLQVRLPVSDPLGALVEDVRAYAAFTFARAPVLERMSDTFSRTKAGLQHSTHLYEGEGKVVGVRLAEVLAKHHRVLTSPAVADLVNDFTTRSRTVHDLYANRIVGF